MTFGKMLIASDFLLNFINCMIYDYVYNVISN